MSPLKSSVSNSLCNEWTRNTGNSSLFSCTRAWFAPFNFLFI
jgi:hypothetical protein